MTVFSFIIVAKCVLYLLALASSTCAFIFFVVDIHVSCLYMYVPTSGMFLQNSLGGGGCKLGFPKIEGGQQKLQLLELLHSMHMASAGVTLL